MFLKTILFAQPRVTKQKKETFSEMKDLVAYIPQTRVAGSLYPLLFCNVSDLNYDLIGWEDHEDPLKDSHNVIYDIEGLANSSVDQSLFSIVKWWPIGDSPPR
jgi:hypothetical protein